MDGAYATRTSRQERRGVLEYKIRKTEVYLKMAIINCPECGKEISDRAETCIYCGYPLKEPMKEEALKKEVSGKELFNLNYS